MRRKMKEGQIRNQGWRLHHEESHRDRGWEEEVRIRLINGFLFQVNYLLEYDIWSRLPLPWLSSLDVSFPWFLPMPRLMTLLFPVKEILFEDNSMGNEKHKVDWYQRLVKSEFKEEELKRESCVALVQLQLLAYRAKRAPSRYFAWRSHYSLRY